MNISMEISYNKQNIFTIENIMNMERIMKTDRMTKALMLFIGSGLWAVALMHGSEKGNAQATNVPEVIEAKKFLLMNDQGKGVAALTNISTGPALILSNDQQNPGILLGTDNTPGKEGSFLNFYSVNGNVEGRILVNKTTQELFLNDEKDQHDATIVVSPKGQGLVLKDTARNIMAGVDIDKLGAHTLLEDIQSKYYNDAGVDQNGPYVSLKNGASNYKALLEVEQGPDLKYTDSKGVDRADYCLDRDGPNVMFSNKDGIQVENFGVLTDGPYLSFSDTKGMDRMWIGDGKEGPGVNLYDGDGNIRAVFGVTQRIDRITGEKTPTEPSTITLYDAKKDILFQKP